MLSGGGVVFNNSSGDSIGSVRNFFGFFLDFGSVMDIFLLLEMDMNNLEEGFCKWVRIWEVVMGDDNVIVDVVIWDSL